MALTRRQLIATTTGTLVLSVLPVKAAHAAEMVDVRMWPAPEYTRVTLEHDEPIKFKYFLVRSPKPYRLVVDIEGLTLTKRYRLIFDVYPVGDDAIADVIANLDNRDPLQEVIKKNTASDQPEKPAEPAKKTTSKTNTQNSGAAVTKNSTKPAEKPKTVSKPPIKKRDLVIVVDAGHGGEDPGAVGKAKTYEKHITLSIAKRLERLIKKERGMKVVMTRNSDHFVSLSQRVMIAQKAKAHLFVSIHADAWTKPSAKGTSVYALAERGATSSAAMWLAKNQNEADLIGGANFQEVDRRLQSVLVDMATSWKIDYSLQWGHTVLQYLAKINTLHRKQVEQAGFLVLKAPGIPSILVETAFISNPQEERKLKTAAYQQKVAEAILSGIKTQVKKNDSIMQG